MTNHEFTRLERLRRANASIAKIDRTAADVARMLAKHESVAND